MQIIDKFVLGKSNDCMLCEDGIAISENIIAVVDGATSKSDISYDGKKSGKFCMDFITDFIETTSGNFNCAADFFTAMSTELCNDVKTRFPCVNPADWPRASVIAFNLVKNEIWSYGDCQCMINGKKFTNEKEIDVLLSRLRALYIEIALLNQINLSEIRENDIGRNEILSLLKSQVQFENNSQTQYGYPVINGHTVNSDMIKVFSVEQGDEVVLATDGYPILRPSLKESEEELQSILDKDPLCFIKFKSTKGILPGNISFDDRAYLRFRV